MVLKIAGYEKNDVLHVQTKTGEEKEVLNRFQEMFFENGIIGLTKEDVEVFFRGKDVCSVGIGEGSGERKIEEAVENALNCIEADSCFSENSRFIISMCGDIFLSDITKARNIVLSRIRGIEEDNLIHAIYDDTITGSCNVMIVVV